MVVVLTLAGEIKTGVVWIWIAFVGGFGTFFLLFPYFLSNIFRINHETTTVRPKLFFTYVTSLFIIIANIVVMMMMIILFFGGAATRIEAALFH